MATILSIETSTKVCSIALHIDSQLIGLIENHELKSHSKVIIEQIQTLLNQSGLQLSAIDAVGVGKGPGSYTGLRIGVSTAKGICFALDKPLIAVNSLEAMAYGVNKLNWERHWLCPMTDARRMEVYCCIFDGEFNLIEPTQAKVMEENAFSRLLNQEKVVFFGDGSMKCKTLLSLNSNAFFLDGIYPSAREIGQIAGSIYAQGSFEDVAYFEPYYLKEFVSTSTK